MKRVREIPKNVVRELVMYLVRVRYRIVVRLREIPKNIVRESERDRDSNGGREGQREREREREREFSCGKTE